MLQCPNKEPNGACHGARPAGDAEQPRRAEHGGAATGAGVGPVCERVLSGARLGRLPAAPIMRTVTAEAAGPLSGTLGGSPDLDGQGRAIREQSLVGCPFPRGFIAIRGAQCRPCMSSNLGLYPQ